MLAGSAFYAGSGVLVKYLTRTDSPSAIIFYMNMLQLPLGLIPAVFVFDWVTPALSDVPWILIWGLSGFAAHYTMARALKLADITIIFPLDFLRLPLMALFGFLIYAETLSPWTLLGGVVIFGANWYAVPRRGATRRLAGSALTRTHPDKSGQTGAISSPAIAMLRGAASAERAPIHGRAGEKRRPGRSFRPRSPGGSRCVPLSRPRSDLRSRSRRDG